MHAGEHISAAPVAVIDYFIPIGGNRLADMRPDLPGLFQISAPGAKIIIPGACAQAADYKLPLKI